MGAASEAWFLYQVSAGKTRFDMLPTMEEYAEIFSRRATADNTEFDFMTTLATDFAWIRNWVQSRLDWAMFADFKNPRLLLTWKNDVPAIGFVCGYLGVSHSLFIASRVALPEAANHATHFATTAHTRDVFYRSAKGSIVGVLGSHSVTIFQTTKPRSESDVYTVVFSPRNDKSNVPPKFHHGFVNERAALAFAHTVANAAYDPHAAWVAELLAGRLEEDDF